MNALLTTSLIILAVIALGIAYTAGLRAGAKLMHETLSAPAREFIDTWYPLGIPEGDPETPMDVMAQVLAPLAGPKTGA